MTVLNAHRCFVLIFPIFVTHGYLYILLIMYSVCSWMHNRVMVINISWILAHIMISCMPLKCSHLILDYIGCRKGK
jgi:hypothetical protein